MSLGEQLRNARLERSLTASEVAAATRMKIQIVEALENEDFTKIAAPIYGKGFIKLYAEHVGLAPAPLIDEYVARFVHKKEPSLRSEEPAPGVKPVTVAEALPPTEPGLFDSAESHVSPGGEVEVDKNELLHPEEGEEGPAPIQNRPASVSEKVHSLGARLSSKVNELRSTVSDIRETATEKRERPKISLTLRDFKSASAIAAVVIVLVFIISGLSRCVRKPSGDELPSVDSTIEELQLAVEPSDPYVE